jgi:enoyl-CoA hydratase/carnithine racemase
VIEVTEQDDVAVLRLADGKANAMSREFCETLTSPNSGAAGTR